MATKPILSVTKAEQVRQAILEMIFAGDLTAGQRIVEMRLAAELNVSQATVNAALQDLHNQGVVTKLLNRSTTVNRYTQREIDNLFQVRMALEPAAAAAAPSRAPRPDRPARANRAHRYPPPWPRWRPRRRAR